MRHSYTDPEDKPYDINDILEDLSREQNQANSGLDLVGEVLLSDSEQRDLDLNMVKPIQVEMQTQTLQTDNVLNSTVTTISTLSSYSSSSDDTLLSLADASTGPLSHQVSLPAQQLLAMKQGFTFSRGRP